MENQNMHQQIDDCDIQIPAQPATSKMTTMKIIFGIIGGFSILTIGLFVFLHLAMSGLIGMKKPSDSIINQFKRLDMDIVLIDEDEYEENTWCMQFEWDSLMFEGESYRTYMGAAANNYSTNFLMKLLERDWPQILAIANRNDVTLSLSDDEITNRSYWEVKVPVSQRANALSFARDIVHEVDGLQSIYNAYTRYSEGVCSSAFKTTLGYGIWFTIGEGHTNGEGRWSLLQAACIAFKD